MSSLFLSYEELIMLAILSERSGWSFRSLLASWRDLMSSDLVSCWAPSLIIAAISSSVFFGNRWLIFSLYGVFFG